MADNLYSPHLDVSQRLFILNSLADTARILSAGKWSKGLRALMSS